MNLTQLIGTLHYLCRELGSNPVIPLIHVRVEFLATNYLTKKKVCQFMDSIINYLNVGRLIKNYLKNYEDL
jgi:hypothetical protein